MKSDPHSEGGRAVKALVRWGRGVVLGGLLCLGIPACAAESEYRPTEQLSGRVQGAPAARYAIPPEAPRGDVTVTSRGVAEVEPKEGGGRAPMLHVALT